ncbi:PREDICTED: uncharacterized protein K02A2.6-like [Priapulus caudatus]|uniref:Uncharacterized protein K02A2.6-like n=1 Tax=Priapulus caudatus TaxID=37621 RepID=A0ABM1E9D1_PRICU|nr:PREDICTED: uncharacterized protein K02A2.6-like [Priapulus caudatus]
MTTGLPQFPAFAVHADSGNTGLRWAKWVAKLENLMIALNITTPKRKRDMMLHYAGDEVYEVFITLPDSGSEDDFELARDSLRNYLDPKRNMEYEVYLFRKDKQAVVCRSRQRREQSAYHVTKDKHSTAEMEAHQSDSSDDECTFGARQHGDKLPTCDVKIEGKVIQYAKKVVETNIHVVDGSIGNLLGYRAAEDLGIIHVAQSVTSKMQTIAGKFPNIFKGMGKAENIQVKLYIDENVEPKQQPHRRIPFHVRKAVERELDKLKEMDVIEKVSGPTPWVSPIVVVPKKNNEVRICVEMRKANEAVKRTKHVMPTIDELITDLNGASVFSVLDLRSAYHQLELQPESRYITTFSTHVGLFRYKRLMFGINAASEIFQNALYQECFPV